MKILLVAATTMEVQGMLDFLDSNFDKKEETVFEKDDLSVKVLITGVGVPATIYWLTQTLLSQPFDLVLNFGICGAFDKNWLLGKVVHIAEDRFGDLGAEERDGTFLTLFDLDLQKSNDVPFQNGILKNVAGLEHVFLPLASGITVNKVHGSAASIEMLKKKFPTAEVETMESAAVFYVCMHQRIHFLVVRAVSNYVEPRNRAGWEIALAIENLNRTGIEMLGLLKK